MYAKIPLSYIFIILGLFALALLELGPIRLIIAFGTLGFFAVYWFFERHNLHINNPANAYLERLEQSTSTLGNYDRDYTNWLESRHGQSVTLSFAKFIAFIAVIGDIYAQVFYSFKLISLKLIGSIVLPLLGINFGMGY
jgi:hypothetical protein